MKRLTLLLLLPVLWTKLGAQTDCFLLLYLEGKTACEQRKFNTGLKSLLAARDCPDKPADSGLENWIRNAEKGRAERNCWHKTLRSDDAESYRSYISQYPEGYYRKKADEQLRRLETLARQPVLQHSSSGLVNWTQEFVEAEGQCVINREKWPNEAQAMLMAQRGAELVAKANLLELLEGVHLTRNTRVRDMETESDELKAHIEGIVKGTRIYGEPSVANGVMKLTLRMPLFGAEGLIRPNYAASFDTGDLNDSLIAQMPALRVASLPPEPALYPSFVDAERRLVLDGESFGKRNAGPLVRYRHADAPSGDEHSLEAAWDAEGRLVLPDTAMAQFRQWLQLREAGGPVAPILVLAP